MANAQQVLRDAAKFGIEIVDDPSIYAQEYSRNEQYRAIWEAIRLLAHLPDGRAVSIPKDERYSKVIAKKAHVYARRWGLNIVTRNAGEVVVIARKVVKSNPTKGDIFPITPRGAVPAERRSNTQEVVCR